MALGLTAKLPSARRGAAAGTALARKNANHWTETTCDEEWRFLQPQEKRAKNIEPARVAIHKRFEQMNLRPQERGPSTVRTPRQQSTTTMPAPVAQPTTSPDHSWPHTNPKRKRGLYKELPSLALRVSVRQCVPRIPGPWRIRARRMRPPAAGAASSAMDPPARFVVDLRVCPGLSRPNPLPGEACCHGNGHPCSPV